MASVEGRVEPLGGRHAIEVAALAVEWEVPASLEQLAAAQDVYQSSPEIQDFLPERKTVEGFVVEANEHGMLLRRTPGGEDFMQPRENGPFAWSVSLRPEFVSCSCAVYDRWANVQPAVQRLMEPFVDKLLHSGAVIKAFGLQYIDVFKVEGEIDREVVEYIFRPMNEWIPSAVLRHPSLWHVHQGWFAGTPEGRRLLNTLNIEAVESEGSFSIRIGGQHRLLAKSFDGKSGMPLDLGLLKEAQHYLHRQNTTILTQLLSNSVLDRIGLTSIGRPS